MLAKSAEFGNPDIFRNGGDDEERGYWEQKEI